MILSRFAGSVAAVVGGGDNYCCMLTGRQLQLPTRTRTQYGTFPFDEDHYRHRLFPLSFRNSLEFAV